MIDSWSTDSVFLEIVRRFPEVRLHEIPNEEFGHGLRATSPPGSRGASSSPTTHDVVPTTSRWLAELIAPFAIDQRIVAVMGKQVPRPGCFPLLKYEIRGHVRRVRPTLARCK